MPFIRCPHAMKFMKLLRAAAYSIHRARGSPRLSAYAAAAFPRDAEAKESEDHRKKPPEPDEQAAGAGSVDEGQCDMSKAPRVGMTSRASGRPWSAAKIHCQCPELPRNPHRAQNALRRRAGAICSSAASPVIANDGTVASLEYGVAVLDSPLILMLATTAARRRCRGRVARGRRRACLPACRRWSSRLRLP